MMEGFLVVCLRICNYRRALFGFVFRVVLWLSCCHGWRRACEVFGWLYLLGGGGDLEVSDDFCIIPLVFYC